MRIVLFGLGSGASAVAVFLFVVLCRIIIIYGEYLRQSSFSRRIIMCSTRNTLNFTWRLVMCPQSVIDYVVVHQLSHIKY